MTTIIIVCLTALKQLEQRAIVLLLFFFNDVFCRVCFRMCYKLEFFTNYTKIAFRSCVNERLIFRKMKEFGGFCVFACVTANLRFCLCVPCPQAFSFYLTTKET